jgi:LmbE family N-acetylglucosaminyl deacetylase
MIRRILNKIETIYKYRYFSRNEKGAYKFLLKKIHKSTDIEFIENVWQLDYFREILEPQPLNIKNFRRVLVLAPHQDDEILGCGGTLLQLAEMGCEIHIGFLTNSAELSNPEESVTKRHLEAQTVCTALNSTMRDLGIDNISMTVQKKHIETLKDWLSQDWDAVFTIWPVDQPPKHRVCSYLVGKAISKSSYNGLINFYSVHTDLLPNFYVDISGEIKKKQELMAYYTSQLKAQRLDHMSKGLDAWRSRFLPESSNKRYVETFMQIPAEAYQDFQNIYEKSNVRKMFKANDTCIKSFEKIGKL